MGNWKSMVNKNQIDWLLEPNNPSVRYFTLKYLLGKPPTDPDILRAKHHIMNTGPVPTILSKQKPEGCWGNPEDFYIRSKYKGTIWSYLLLAELGADGADERIKSTSEFILNHAQDSTSGGFAYYSKKTGGGDRNKILPCLTGNMLWCLIRFGYLKDPRVQHGIDWITKYQRFDDGIPAAPRGWPYEKFQNCWGNHTCTMGVVKTLNALAEIPQNQRSRDIQTTIEKGAEYLLIHHLFKRSHNLDQVAKPGWIKLGFPLMWQIDVLEMLLILTRLGYKDERMQDAINVVLSKQTAEGAWVLEKTFNRRMQVHIENKGKPSKWVTLRALTVLKQWYS
jgi:hypothetical protein